MTSMLENLSDALAAVTEQAGASVVRVSARRRLPASGVVWASEGVILTANHVVERDEKIEIGLPDGSEVSASLIGRDATTDLAVLRAEAGDLNPAAWAAPDSLAVGHLALALGRPGHTVQATLGVVSALGGAWRTPAGGEIDRYLQTDVVMYPGFSGGPLVGAGGQILGLNSSALMRGVSLAVPYATAANVVDTLLTHGRVRRGYLGVGVQPVRLPEAIASELGQETGVLLTSVEPDSPAAQGGLLLGDTIVTFDGEAVAHTDALLAQLTGSRVGRQTELRVLRGGALQTLTVTVGER